MGIKLAEQINQDGTHRAWLFHCPACDDPHQCDDRWTFNGDQSKPTFRASVLVHYSGSDAPQRCHSFVTDGNIAYCGDSTHAMAGKTVELPDWDDRHKGKYGGTR